MASNSKKLVRDFLDKIEKNAKEKNHNGKSILKLTNQGKRHLTQAKELLKDVKKKNGNLPKAKSSFFHPI